MRSSLRARGATRLPILFEVSAAPESRVMVGVVGRHALTEARTAGHGRERLHALLAGLRTWMFFAVTMALLHLPGRARPGLTLQFFRPFALRLLAAHFRPPFVDPIFVAKRESMTARHRSAASGARP